MKARPPRRRFRMSNWLLLVETGLCLGFAALAKRTLPFRTFPRVLGPRVERPTAPPLPPELATDLVWAFGVFHRRRLRPLCLTEVLALSLLLRRRGLRGASFLGVARKAPFQAHAWMRCGDRILPRAQDLSPYRVIAVFQPPHPTP